MSPSERCRVVDPRSPFTVLQQRLRYVDRFPERDWTNVVENVPCWPQPIATFAPESTDVLKYAPCEGNVPLLDALVGREQERNRLSISRDQLVITNGGMHAISLVVRSLKRAGNIALVQAPVFTSVAQILRAAGMELRYFRADDGRVDIDALGSARNIGLIYLNSPNNPTGAVLRPETLSQLLDFSRSCHAAILLDAVYDSFIFDDLSFRAPPTGFDWDRVYVVNSMSKNYGAPGLRLGWVVASTLNIQSISALLECECVSVSGPSQRNAIKLIAQGNSELVAHVRDGRRFVMQTLPSVKGARFIEPMGGTQILVELPVEDVEVFGDYVLTELGLVLATRSQYQGLAGPFIRFPLGAPRALQERALELLSTGLSRFVEAF